MAFKRTDKEIDRNLRDRKLRKLCRDCRIVISPFVAKCIDCEMATIDRLICDYVANEAIKAT